LPSTGIHHASGEDLPEVATGWQDRRDEAYERHIDESLLNCAGWQSVWLDDIGRAMLDDGSLAP